MRVMITNQPTNQSLFFTSDLSSGISCPYPANGGVTVFNLTYLGAFRQEVYCLQSSIAINQQNHYEADFAFQAHQTNSNPAWLAQQ